MGGLRRRSRTLLVIVLGFNMFSIRMTLYLGLAPAGFFFFWVLTAICSAVTAWLVRTAPKRDAKNR